MYFGGGTRHLTGANMAGKEQRTRGAMGTRRRRRTWATAAAGFAQAPAAPPPADPYLCPACKKAIDPSAAVCPRCGADNIPF